MNFETWKEFYNFGWATEQQLEEAVSLGELTPGQYDQIMGITDTPAPPKKIVPKEDPVKETPAKEIIPKEVPVKEIPVTIPKDSTDDKENKKDDDIIKKQDDKLKKDDTLIIPRG